MRQGRNPGATTGQTSKPADSPRQQSWELRRAPEKREPLALMPGVSSAQPESACDDGWSQWGGWRLGVGDAGAQEVVR